MPLRQVCGYGLLRFSISDENQTKCRLPRPKTTTISSSEYKGFARRRLLLRWIREIRGYAKSDWELLRWRKLEPPRGPVPSPAPSKIDGAGIPGPEPGPGPRPAISIELTTTEWGYLSVIRFCNVFLRWECPRLINTIGCALTQNEVQHVRHHPPHRVDTLARDSQFWLWLWYITD